MVGLIATTLLAGARMPAGATSNMKRKIPRDAADRIAVDGRERDVRNLASLPAEGEVFFLDIPFYRTPLLGAFSRSKFLGVAPARPERLGAVFCPRAAIEECSL